MRKRLGEAVVRMLAYNGSIPGPTLRVSQGSEVTINFTNEADLETTVHWHSLRLDNRYDGVPGLVVAGALHHPIPVPRWYICPFPTQIVRLLYSVPRACSSTSILLRTVSTNCGEGCSMR